MQPKDYLETYQSLDPFERVAAMVRVLTGPQGCPWDQKQTALSIVDYVIDEAHELKSALLTEDSDEVVGEWGDLMFTTEFLFQALGEKHQRTAAATNLVDKMIRRHPHVFTDQRFDTEAEIKRNWEAEKRKENNRRERLDEDIPASLPPLKKAMKVLGRVSNSGFWYKQDLDCWDKITEEFFELESSLEQPEEFEDEFGDLLLALLTLAKMKGCKPEVSLGKAVKKFCDRLQGVEKAAGKPLEEIPHEQLGGWYKKVKDQPEDSTAYFNYCGVSPWPRPVRNKVRQACHRIASQGLPAALEMLEEREVLKEKIRAFVGAPEKSSVVLVPNVSTAATGVAYAQTWQPGDSIILGESEFPANTVPWRQAAGTFDVQVHWFDEDLLRSAPEAGWSKLEQLLEQHRPRLFPISAVSFWSGYRYSLEKLAALCDRYGTRLYVDAIQALGNTPYRWVDSLDYLAGGSHKSLLSPEGAGFLVVSERASKDWTPRLASWLSVPEPIDFLLNGEWQSVPSRAAPRVADPSTLQGASVNAIGYAGLEAALDYLQELDVAQISTHISHLQDRLESELTSLGWQSLRAAQSENQSAILSFRPPAGVELTAVQSHLGERGVSAGIPNGALRFGFHSFNEAPQVDKVIEIMRAMPLPAAPSQ